MASITSTGVGSGLDVNSLVTQLVAAERQPQDKRIAATDARLTTEFTALAKLKAAMSGFQAAVSTMTTAGAFEPRFATVEDKSYFSANAASTAAAGHYDIEVKQLAQAAQLGSPAFAGGQDAVVGTGTLTITVGAKSFAIAVDADHDSLAQIRDAINDASDNAGVRATLIRDVSGARLVLTGSATGAANGIQVSASGGDGGLDQLAYVDGGTMNLTQLAAAQDAVVFVSGYEVHGETNTVTDAIDGVTLTLTKAEAGKKLALDIGRDDAALQAKVEAFVNAFNTLADQMRSLGGYDAETKTAGPLLGDALLRGVDTQLRRYLSDAVKDATGRSGTLAGLGITTTATGRLELDTTKFKSAMAADPEAARRVFSGDSGVAVKVNTFLTARLSSTGELATRNATVTSKRADLTKQQQALDARMEVIQARYLKQFTALDSLLTQMQSTSSYLTQQFDSLAKLNKG